jgi:hypothetical protein
MSGRGRKRRKLVASGAEHDEPHPALRRPVVGCVDEGEGTGVPRTLELALDRPENAADLSLLVPRGDQTLDVLEQDQGRSQRPGRPHEVLEEASSLIIDSTLLPRTAEALTRGAAPAKMLISVGLLMTTKTVGGRPAYPASPSTEKGGKPPAR